MNWRVILFSGIMTAFIGVMMGAAIAHIAQRESRKSIYIAGGAIMGFLLGSASSIMLQQRQERAEDYHDIDRGL